MRLSGDVARAEVAVRLFACKIGHLHLSARNDRSDLIHIKAMFHTGVSGDFCSTKVINNLQRLEQAFLSERLVDIWIGLFATSFNRGNFPKDELRPHGLVFSQRMAGRVIFADHFND